MEWSIYRKLGVKPNNLVYFFNGHENFFRKAKSMMPTGVAIRRKLAPDETADLIFVWPEEGGEWTDLFKVLKMLLKANGAVWAVIPRKEVALEKGVNVLFGDVQHAALKAGLVDNKVARVSEKEYAIRFVRRARS
ncbi:MAG: DUF3052 family protein [Acidobacteriota bacterium]